MASPDLTDGLRTQHHTSESSALLLDPNSRLNGRANATNGGEPVVIRRKPLPGQPHPIYNSGSDTPRYQPLNQSTGVNHDQALQDREGKDGPVDTHTAVAPTTDYNDSTSWLPYSLRWPFLVLIICLCLLLSIVLVLLTWWSFHNNGLGDDTGRNILLFGWKFSPTLIAVLYVLLTTVLLNDVKRTEPFARMARTTEASTKDTLLQSPGAWWNALIDGFNRPKNNRGIGWILIASSVLNIIGFLAISPLSSSVLIPEDRVIVEEAQFKQVNIAKQAPLSLTADDDVYFRTLSNLLYNVTTSAWLTDNFAVLPFWPSDIDPPFGSQFTTLPQTWQGMTTVFQAQMECSPMKLTATGAANLTGGYEEIPYITLTSTDNCRYQLHADLWEIYMVRFGGGTWSAVDNITISSEDEDEVTWSNANSQYTPLTASGELWVDYSEECKGREIMIYTTAFTNNTVSQMWEEGESFSKNLTAGGQVCSTSLYSAKVSVTAASSAQGASSLTFSTDEYEKIKAPIPSSVMNLSSFQGLFLNQQWTSKIYHMDSKTYPDSSGPLIVLETMYNSDMEAMIQDSNIVDQAIRVKQRFLGEVLLSTFQTVGSSEGSLASGTITRNQRRIMVSEGVAIGLASLLCISALLTLYIWYATRLPRRQLHLHEDPSTLAAVARLVYRGSEVSTAFQGLDQASEGQIATQLQTWTCKIQDNSLIALLSSSRTPNDQSELPDLKVYKQGLSNHVQQETGTDKRADKKKSWKPFVLRRIYGLALIAFLLVLLVAIAVLYGLSNGPGLYEKAFVYQTQISLWRGSSTTIAPYSIVPTLVAVGVSLWWGSLDDSFRRLQPYISMAKRPTANPAGASLSYGGSYLLWAVSKALTKRHWLLALVCTGTCLSQVFTVAMSALWQREPAVTSKRISVSTPLELRLIPSLFDIANKSAEASGEPQQDVILSSIYDNSSANWMYSAVINMTYNGSQLGWSQAGWSFAPADLSSVPTSGSVQQQGLNDTESPGTPSQATSSSVNMIFDSPALRARIECSPYESLLNQSNWLTFVDLTNETAWNVSANPKNLQSGYELNFDGITLKPGSATLENGTDMQILTPFFVNGNQLQCCSNSTDGGAGRAAIGYWSYNTPAFVGSLPWDWWDHYPLNFTVKWIVGNPEPTLYLASSNVSSSPGNYLTHLIWSAPPRLAALNCLPVIESANASVTVDSQTGVVQQYTLLDEPKPYSEAWTDAYVVHNVTPGSPQPVTDPTNYTCSFGVLFQDAILTAGDLTQYIRGSGTAGGPDMWGLEDTNEDTFNFRMTGLNMDFPSYAMYILANQDPEALLDLTALEQNAQTAFATLFTHFALSNVSLTDGSWAFQHVGAKLPSDLGPITYRDLPSDPTADATVTVSIELLHMSPVAAILCLTVLAFMLVTAFIVFVIEYKYFQRLHGDVDTLADVIKLVYDSPQLLRWADEEDPRRPLHSEHLAEAARLLETPSDHAYGPTTRASDSDAEVEEEKVSRNSKTRILKTSVLEVFRPTKTSGRRSAKYQKHQSQVRTRLTTFIGGSGKERWGVEIVD